LLDDRDRERVTAGTAELLLATLSTAIVAAIDSSAVDRTIDEGVVVVVVGVVVVVVVVGDGLNRSEAFEGRPIAVELTRFRLGTV
jgi:Ca2+/H+ antiporter